MSMPTRGAGQKIVVADDDPLLSQVLVRALDSRGYNAVQAPAGLISADLIADATLVILDAHIPGADFLSTLSALRELPLGILILSGELSPPEGVRSDEYLAKPVDLGDLLGAVARLATATTAA